MRKKDIITVVVAVIVIGASIYFILQLLYPSNNAKTTVKESDNINDVPSDIDSTLGDYQKVEDLSDYGTPTLSNIGKTDLFSGF